MNRTRNNFKLLLHSFAHSLNTYLSLLSKFCSVRKIDFQYDHIEYCLWGAYHDYCGYYCEWCSEFAPHSFIDFRLSLFTISGDLAVITLYCLSSFVFACRTQQLHFHSFLAIFRLKSKREEVLFGASSSRIWLHLLFAFSSLQFLKAPRSHCLGTVRQCTLISRMSTRNFSHGKYVLVRRR